MGVRDGNFAYFHRHNSDHEKGSEKWVGNKACKDGEDKVKECVSAKSFA